MASKTPETNSVDEASNITQIPENATVLEKHFQSKSLGTIIPFLTEKVEQLKSRPFNIAVTGHTGTGKSSFINAIRGLNGDDPGASKVDVVECTLQRHPFIHPTVPELWFWDLPGAGTSSFPKDEYIEKVRFDTYDYFILITADRFREIDLFLAKEIKRRGKDMLFIRTKIDQDVENFNRNRRHKFDKESILTKIRDDILNNLKKGNINDPIIFLISNFEKRSWNFPTLNEILIENWKSLKQSFMVGDLLSICTYTITVKRKALKKKILSSATSAAWGCLVPIPGWSNSKSKHTLKNEIKHLTQEFGLDILSLANLSIQLNCAPYYLYEQLPNAVSQLEAAEWVSQLLKTDRTFSFAEWKRFLPVVGTLSSCSDTYYGIESKLNQVLDVLEGDIKTLFKVIVNIVVGITEGY